MSQLAPLSCKHTHKADTAGGPGAAYMLLGPRQVCCLTARAPPMLPTLVATDTTRDALRSACSPTPWGSLDDSKGGSTPAPHVYSFPAVSTAAANWPVGDTLMCLICRAQGSFAGVACTFGQPPVQSVQGQQSALHRVCQLQQGAEKPLAAACGLLALGCMLIGACRPLL